MLGDNTGIVDAELPIAMYYLKEGMVVKFENVKVDVINSHIMVLAKDGVTRPLLVPEVRLLIKEDNNISEHEWLEEYHLVEEEFSGELDESEISQSFIR